MKILRIFDSLKLVLATVACVFAIVPAHAATLPAGYTELEYLESTDKQYIDTNATLNTSTDNVEIVFQTVSDNIANVRINLFGARSTTASNAYTLGVANGGWRFGWGNSSPSFGTANTNKHTARIEHDNGVLKIDDTVIATSGNASITTPTTATLFAIQTNGSTPLYYGTFKIYSYKKWTNDILVQNFVPVRRDSDGVLGMYDLADSNPETAFHTNAGTGAFTAGEYKIKIATTKYNEESFAQVKTDLSAAVNAVEYVVSNTMSQAQAIDTIATTKQTRPAEGCPPFKKCLLVEDENGTPHWYEIYDPINDFLNPILAAAGLSGNQGAPMQTTHTCGSDSTCYDEYNGFYMGNGEFRQKYIDSSNSTYERPFGPTTLARCSVPVGEHTNTDTREAGLCYNEGGMFRELTEGPADSAGEWALVWNGGEGGASLGITPGVVYGVAKCTTVGQHTTEMTGDFADGSNYWWPKKLTGYSGGGTTLASLIEQYPNSNIETVFNTLPNLRSDGDNPENPRANYRNCWCKMTAIGVPGAGETDDQRYANGTIMSVGGGWVFYYARTSATNCVSYCATYCAYGIRAYAAFRRAVLTVE